MIYLDSAATSLYKPECVQPAMLEAVRSMASPGRGAHQAAMRAADCCYLCRERLAELFHAPSPENVVFTCNATHGLNIAIRSVARPGSRVLISGYEHNSVTRPLHALGAKPVVIDTPLFAPDAFLREAERKMPSVDAVVCSHVSNVFGYILPVERLAALCRRYEKPFVLDASQSAGVLDIDVQALDAQFVAMPGHKGLLGPQGTGVLLCKNDAIPLLYGGSGSDSLLPAMPDFLPDRLEAGTHNMPGIAGLSAAVQYILERGCASIRAVECERMRQFTDALERCGGLRLFRCTDERLQSAVLSVIPESGSCEALADALDKRGVAVRNGLHCAPLAHRTAGTLQSGTVRFSFSPFNTRLQMTRAAELCKSALHDFR